MNFILRSGVESAKFSLYSEQLLQFFISIQTFYLMIVRYWLTNHENFIYKTWNLHEHFQSDSFEMILMEASLYNNSYKLYKNPVFTN